MGGLREDVVLCKTIERSRRQAQLDCQHPSMREREREREGRREQQRTRRLEDTLRGGSRLRKPHVGEDEQQRDRRCLVSGRPFDCSSSQAMPVSCVGRRKE